MHSLFEDAFSQKILVDLHESIIKTEVFIKKF